MGSLVASLAAVALVACGSKDRAAGTPPPSTSLAPSAVPAEPVASAAPSLDGGGEAPAPVRACPAALLARANAIVDAWRKKHGVPGVAVAVVDDGAPCVVTSGVRDGRGPVAGDTAFAMGSVQKVFNATLLAYGIEQGKARLEDPASRWLVAENGKTIPPEAPFAKATLKNLVTHTASLVKDDSDDAEPDDKALGKDTAVEDERNGWNLYRDKAMPASMLSQVLALRPRYPFGTRYAYSNDGFVLAGYAAAEITKTPYGKLFTEVVAAPLALRRTGPALCDAPKDFCATGHTGKGDASSRTAVGLWTTADDMARFVLANLGALPLPDTHARAFRRTHVPLFDIRDGRSIAMGWEIFTRGATELHAKNGASAGFSSWVGLEPRTRRGVAVLTNVQHRVLASPAALGHELLEAMRAPKP